MDNKNYRVCATCLHFNPEKREQKMKYYCKRLGYETKTTYSFSCWNPKENVKKLMEKRGVLNE